MRNRERTWDETRHGIEHHRIDDLLAAPWLGYAAGLVFRDAGLLGIALAAWFVAVVIWTPWIVFRVLMSDPPGDGASAGAVLGLGLAPWIPVVVATPWLSNWIVLALVFPATALWGAAAMLMAARRRPRPRTARGRALLLAAGGLAYGLVAVGLLATAFVGAREMPGAILLPLLLLGGLAAFGCVRVLLAIRRPSTGARSAGT